MKWDSVAVVLDLRVLQPTGSVGSAKAHITEEFADILNNKDLWSSLPKNINTYKTITKKSHCYSLLINLEVFLPVTFYLVTLRAIFFHSFSLLYVGYRSNKSAYVLLQESKYSPCQISMKSKMEKITNRLTVTLELITLTWLTENNL